MRISDWSSDVCSSDLCTGVGLRRQAVGERRPVGKAGAERLLVVKVLLKLGHHEQSLRGDQARLANVLREITGVVLPARRFPSFPEPREPPGVETGPTGRASCRERV